MHIPSQMLCPNWYPSFLPESRTRDSCSICILSDRRGVVCCYFAQQGTALLSEFGMWPTLSRVITPRCLQAWPTLALRDGEVKRCRCDCCLSHGSADRASRAPHTGTSSFALPRAISLAENRSCACGTVLMVCCPCSSSVMFCQGCLERCALKEEKSSPQEHAACFCRKIHDDEDHSSRGGGWKEWSGAWYFREVFHREPHMCVCVCVAVFMCVCVLPSSVRLFKPSPLLWVV